MTAIDALALSKSGIACDSATIESSESVNASVLWPDLYNFEPRKELSADLSHGAGVSTDTMSHVVHSSLSLVWCLQFPCPEPSQRGPEFCV